MANSNNLFCISIQKGNFFERGGDNAQENGDCFYDHFDRGIRE